jgi:hypothetical protein
LELSGFLCCSLVTIAGSKPVTDRLLPAGLLVTDLGFELYTFLYNLPFLIPSLFSAAPWCELRVPPPPAAALCTALLAPLVTIDIVLQTALLIYAIAYQVLLYLVYLVLFLYCHLTGQYGRLEKRGPSRRSAAEEVGGEEGDKSKMETRQGDESGYVTTEDDVEE